MNHDLHARAAEFEGAIVVSGEDEATRLVRALDAALRAAETELAKGWAENNRVVEMAEAIGHDLADARYRITKLETAEREGRAYESELEAENARLLIELAAARTATTAPEDS